MSHIIDIICFNDICNDIVKEILKYTIDDYYISVRSVNKLWNKISDEIELENGRLIKFNKEDLLSEYAYRGEAFKYYNLIRDNGCVVYEISIIKDGYMSNSKLFVKKNRLVTNGYYHLYQYSNSIMKKNIIHLVYPPNVPGPGPVFRDVFLPNINNIKYYLKDHPFNNEEFIKKSVLITTNFYINYLERIRPDTNYINRYKDCFQNYI